MLVYNALNYRNIPGDFGLPIEILYRRADQDPIPREVVVRAANRAARRNAPLVLDLEYPLPEASPLGVSVMLAKCRQAARWAKQVQPRTRLGIYQVPDAFGRSLVNRYAQASSSALGFAVLWQLVRGSATAGATYPYFKDIPSEALINDLDLLCPSFYAYEPAEVWLDACDAMVDLIRRICGDARPLIPFLTPINWRVRPAVPWDEGFWREQLEFCSRRCDGIILWHSDNSIFDPNAAWVRELRRWM